VVLSFRIKGLPADILGLKCGLDFAFVLLFTESDTSGDICELENISTRPLETAYF